MIFRTRTKYDEESKERIAGHIDGDILELVIFSLNEETGLEEERIKKQINLKDIFKPFTSYNIFFNERRTDLTEPFFMPANKWGGQLRLDVMKAGSEHVALIYFNKSYDDGLVMFINIPADVELCEEFRNMDAILKLFPDFQNEYDRITKKKEVLTKIDCHNSLSGLEPQVDYLTLLVKELINNDDSIKEKIAKKYPNLDTFFKICEDNNVALVKPDEVLFEEIKTQKESIRSIQSEYIEIKEK